MEVKYLTWRRSQGEPEKLCPSCWHTAINTASWLLLHCWQTQTTHGKHNVFKHMYALQYTMHAFTLGVHKQLLPFFLLSSRRILQEYAKCSLSQVILTSDPFYHFLIWNRSQTSRGGSTGFTASAQVKKIQLFMNNTFSSFVFHLSNSACSCILQMGASIQSSLVFSSVCTHSD